MTDTPKPEWSVELAEGETRTVQADSATVWHESLVFLDAERGSEILVRAFAPGTWVSVHRVRREK